MCKLTFDGLKNCANSYNFLEDSENGGGTNIYVSIFWRQILWKTESCIFLIYYKSTLSFNQSQ